MKYLLLVFIIVPALEIGLFIMAGKSIGVLATVALIIATGIIGAYLAKRQGLETLRNMQKQIRLGEPPGYALLDGICVLFGGLLLLAPGFLTDIIGLLLLMPITKNAMRPLLLAMIKKWFTRKSQIYIYR